MISNCLDDDDDYCSLVNTEDEYNKTSTITYLNQ